MIQMAYANSADSDQQSYQGLHCQSAKYLRNNCKKGKKLDRKKVWYKSVQDFRILPHPKCCNDIALALSFKTWVILYYASIAK